MIFAHNYLLLSRQLTIHRHKPLLSCC